MIDKLIGREVKIGNRVFTVFAAELTSRGPQALLLRPDSTLIWSDLSGVTLMPETPTPVGVMSEALESLLWADMALSSHGGMNGTPYEHTPLGQKISAAMNKLETYIREQSK